MTLPRRILLVPCSVGLACVALVAAFYGIENWRGAHAWTVCQRDLEARGEHLDVASFIPPPIPDDENLAMAPLFVRIFNYRIDPATHLLALHPSETEKNLLRDEISAMPHGEPRVGAQPPSGTGDWTVARHYDLAKWQAYYRARPDFPHAPSPGAPAEDVLLALSRYAPVLDELAQAAAARPRARFPVNWTQQPPWLIAMPHGSTLQNFSAALRARAVVELSLGRTADTMRDLGLMDRLRDAEAADPVLIALLVNQVQAAFMLQVVWEGLADRRWSAVELGQLQDGLRRIDFLAETARAIRCERVTFLAATADGLKAHGGAGRMLNAVENYMPASELTTAQRFYGRLLDLAPGGWWDQNKAYGFRVIQDDVLGTLDVAGHHVSLAKTAAGHDAILRISLSPYTFLSRAMSLSIYELVTRKALTMQVGVDQGLVACALERFYLDHHAYPARLDELTPVYLDRMPPDVIDGGPMRYRLTPDGRFLLYSVGWNGRDDGGQVAWQKDSLRRDNDKGDLVWQYAEPQPPTNIQRSK